MTCMRFVRQNVHIIGKEVERRREGLHITYHQFHWGRHLTSWSVKFVGLQIMPTSPTTDRPYAVSALHTCWSFALVASLHPYKYAMELHGLFCGFKQDLLSFKHDLFSSSESIKTSTEWSYVVLQQKGEESCQDYGLPHDLLTINYGTVTSLGECYSTPP